jgi:hypothetical protein
MPLHKIKMSFEIDDNMPPQTRTLHSAMKGVKAIVVEAPTRELAELYVTEIIDAVVEVANRSVR